LTESGTGELLPDAPYFLRLNDGVVFHGVTDGEGFTDIPQSESKQSGKIYVGHAALLKIAEFTGKT
jgi:type VI secretion system secreted protein VgrG